MQFNETVFLLFFNRRHQLNLKSYLSGNVTKFGLGYKTILRKNEFFFLSCEYWEILIRESFGLYKVMFY